MIKQKMLITIFIFLFSLQTCLANEEKQNLTQDEIVNIMTVSSLSKYIKSLNDSKNSFSSEFMSASQKFNQSNTIVAYKEFSNLVNSTVDNDFRLLNLAYKLSSIGFFSISQSAILKIEDENMYKEQIKAIKSTYYPECTLNYDEEIYLAEKTADISFNNLIVETTKELNKNSKLIKKSDYANYILALGYLKQKEFPKAINSINRAISLSPETLNYQKFKAEILIANSQYKDGLKLIKTLELKHNCAIAFEDNLNSLEYFALFKQKENNIKGKYYYAKYLYINKDYQKALKILSQIPAKKQKNVELQTLNADLYSALKETQKANESYIKALNINPKYVPALIGLGDLYFSKQEISSALYFYEKALKSEKISSNILTKIANCHLILNNNEKAIKYVNQALATDGKNSQGYFIKAKTDTKNAQELIKKAISLNPVDADYWFELALNYMEQNNLKDAKTCLMAGNILSPNDYKNYYYQYLIDIKQNNEVGAVNNLNKALELNKNLKHKIEKNDKL